MDKETALWYGSIIELILIISIGAYFISKATTKYYIESVNNDPNSKQNPLYIIFGDIFKKSDKKEDKNPSKGMLNGVMGQKVKQVFKRFIDILAPVFKVFGKIFKYFQTAINRIRSLLSPFRKFLLSIVNQFYMKIQNFTIGILYSLHKMRNAMKRSVSGFNLLIHTLEHSKNSLESTVNSLPVKLLVGFADAVNFISGSHGKMSCFEENTILKLLSNDIKIIKNIEVGDILQDGSVVIAKHVFKNYDFLYKYRDVYVTGNHILLENNEWTTVKESMMGIEVPFKPEYIYCISTSTSIINIDNTIFKDFGESINPQINYTINSLILMHLNRNILNTELDIDKFASETKYNESGFSSNTPIEYEDGTSKSIKDVKIGDILRDNNIVLGKVELLSKYFTFYEDRGIIVSNNTKTKVGGIWYNIEKTDYKVVENNDYKFYNLVTLKETIPVYFAKEYRDYFEVGSKEVNNIIEKLILNL